MNTMREKRTFWRLPEEDFKRLDYLTKVYMTDRSGLLRIWIWQEAQRLGIKTPIKKNRSFHKERRKNNGWQILSIRLSKLELAIVEAISTLHQHSLVEIPFIRWIEYEYERLNTKQAGK